MSWWRRPHRPWHYRYGDGKFVCGTWLKGYDFAEHSATIPVERLCRGCERMMFHAEIDAMGYVGQARSRLSIRQSRRVAQP